MDFTNKNFTDYCEDIIKHYGIENQKRKLQEECSELIRAIARNDEHNMLEEIADVEILIEQFMTIGSNFEDVEHIRIRKLERTIKHIEAEKNKEPDKSVCLAIDCLRNPEPLPCISK